MFTGTLGLTGLSGTSACFTRVSLTVLVPFASVASMSCTTFVRLCEVALAISVACTGSVPCTVIEMSVVLVGAVAVTIVASWSAFMSSPSDEMTGRRTIGVCTRFEYVSTRCCVNVLPCARSLALPDVSVETNTCAEAEYTGFFSRENPAAAATPTRASTTMSTHPLRSTVM